jgi:hypothetical protein
MRLTIDCPTVSPSPYRGPLKDISKQEIMESLWCMKKNSITNWILYRADLPLALTPCLKAECDKWRDGECIQIRKAGKPEKSQVFCRQDS